VIAHDAGEVRHLSAQVSVIIYVIDANDNAPGIVVNSVTSTGHDPEIRENSRVDTLVAHVSVDDPDSGYGGQWTCGLETDVGGSAGAFSLRRMPSSTRQGTGEFMLVSVRGFDREETELLRVGLTCADQGEYSVFIY